MHDALIYQFATTGDESEAYSIMLLIIEQYLAQYNLAREEFAEDNGFSVDGYSDAETINDYALYLYTILAGMRERAKEQEKKLQQESADEAAYAAALMRFVMNDYEMIDTTEKGNAIQTGQLSAVSVLQEQRGEIKIYKEWVAHPDCCEVCAKLNGTVLPIDEPFLVDGQVVELPDGKEFEYKYKDRLIAIAHPNDRCHVEFSIEI